MYLVKVCKGTQILDVLHYKKFENVCADIADKTIFEGRSLPESILQEIDKCKSPQIYCASTSAKGVADAFEFRFENEIYVYVGAPLLQDKIETKK